MTLGSGAEHSEQNASKSEPMEFLQLWILPDTPSLPPGIQQRQLTKEERTGRLLQVIGPNADALKVRQDAAAVFVAALPSGTEVSHGFPPGRGGYLYLIEGGLMVGTEELATGDAVKIREEPALRLTATQPSELILVDVPLDFTPVGVWAR
jgi:redox-sensitive bicupin YhaK (pirin superfamily)